MNKKYIENYLAKINYHLHGLDHLLFFKFIELVKKTSKNRKKVILIGNGGSCAMSSHVSVDLTKQCGIRAVTFSDADLITCFANDYGHENWMQKAIEKYYDKGDLVILISSSGNSKNHLVAANFCKKKKLNLVTFTGFGGRNKLSKLGVINFFLDSKNYNQIEMTHHIWLLLMCDYITKSKF